MWTVTTCLLTIWFLVQVNASPEISLDDLVERLVTLEDWKRETEKEVSSLRETVSQQGIKIRNLERDLAIQVNQTAPLMSCKEDEPEEPEDHVVEDVYDTVREGQAPVNRIIATDLHNQIPMKPPAVNKRQIAGGVAFTAYLDHDMNLNKKQSIKFNRIVTNEGNAYNVHTGAFTCPEAGVYLFSFFLGERDNAGIWAEITVNDRLIVNAAVDTAHSSQDLQGGNMAVIRLSQGDAVWVDAVGSGNHVEGSNLRLTTFSGVYLYA